MSLTGACEFRRQLHPQAIHVSRHYDQVASLRRLIHGLYCNPPVRSRARRSLYSVLHTSILFTARHCEGAPAATHATETCQGVAGGSGRGREAPAGTRTRACARARDESCIRTAHLRLAVASPRHFPVAYSDQDLAFSQVEPAAGQSCHDLNFSETLPRRLCNSSTAVCIAGLLAWLLLLAVACDAVTRSCLRLSASLNVSFRTAQLLVLSDLVKPPHVREAPVP
jgi:hypothetical protein